MQNHHLMEKVKGLEETKEVCCIGVIQRVFSVAYR